MDARTEAGGYESWFVSARDPASDRALWIRHTRHRPVEGPESAALWCTAAGRDLGGPPVVVKEVFGAFPTGAPDQAAAGGGAAGDQDAAGRGDGACRIVLTHMSADMLASQAEAELPAAYDGMTVEL